MIDQKMIKRLVKIFTLGLVAFCSHASAAILIEHGCTGQATGNCPSTGEVTSVYIYGTIDDATAVEVARIDGRLPVGAPFPPVFINSDGGSIAAAEWIGRILRRRQASIEGRDVLFPDRDARCYSACVLLSLGAVTRQFRDIGVHRGHIEVTKRLTTIGVRPTDAAQESRGQAYLNEMGAHPGLRTAIEQTPFDEITYFSFDDNKPADAQPIVEFGFRMRAEPPQPGKGRPSGTFVYTVDDHALAIGVERGDVAAAKELGFGFLFGRGGHRKDIDIGLEYLEKAATLGDISTRHLLGVIFRNGYAGVTKDMSKALEHYRIAAEAGWAGSQNNLGFHLFKGQGAAKNIPEAVYWITRSAEQGEPFAYSSLGEMRFEDGIFPVDDIETYKWLKLAVQYMPKGTSRDHDADLLARVTVRMSEAQIVEAERRVSAWRPLVQTRALMRDKDD